MRAHHGKPYVLEAIKERMDFDFDRTWKSFGSKYEFMSESERDQCGAKPKHIYNCGLFTPDGVPHFSVPGIVLNMFRDGAWVYFYHKHNHNIDKAWSASRRFMQKHLFDILIFSENPVDSLHDAITGKFRISCGEKWDRQEALDNYASCIYGWILREERPWYRHPRWHIHHWRLTCYPLWRRKRIEYGSRDVAQTQ
jgi:hypothetical protein